MYSREGERNMTSKPQFEAAQDRDASQYHGSTVLSLNESVGKIEHTSSTSSGTVNWDLEFNAKEDHLKADNLHVECVDQEVPDAVKCAICHEFYPRALIIVTNDITMCTICIQ